MAMAHFVHAANFHCGEKISALGRETSNTDEHNVWLGKRRTGSMENGSLRQG